MSASSRIVLLLALAFITTVGFLAVVLGFIPSPMAETVVRFRAGKLSMKRGTLRSQVRDDLAEVLAVAGVANAFICINQEGRVSFSHSIPPTLHQRLRNVLLN
jgi:hypothetical protein